MYADLEHGKRGFRILCIKRDALNSEFPLAPSKRVARRSTRINDGIDIVVSGLFAITKNYSVWNLSTWARECHKPFLACFG